MQTNITGNLVAEITDLIVNAKEAGGVRHVLKSVPLEDGKVIHNVPYKIYDSGLHESMTLSMATLSKIECIKERMNKEDLQSYDFNDYKME